jgi:hypothetical protein
MSCGQNLENMGVTPVVARAHCTASALTMMRESRIRGKVRCHTRRWNARGTKVTQSKPGLMTGFVVAPYFAIPIRSAWEAETNRINHLGPGLVWQRTCNLKCDCLPRN